MGFSFIHHLREKSNNFINSLFNFLFSEEKKRSFERFIFIIAILAFISHLIVILLIRAEIISPYFYTESGNIPNPLSVLYTPFSIILIYEVYLLIYYLPLSITIYLGKQYEIMTLIFIRNIFESLSVLPEQNLDFHSFTINNMFVAFSGLIVLLLLIFMFYKLSNKNPSPEEGFYYNTAGNSFIKTKQVLTLLLLAVFIFLFLQNIFQLSTLHYVTFSNLLYSIKTLNNSFFNTFFTALIVTEVLLLLFMFKLDDCFHKVIRNSGFIISTTLLKLTFRTEGMLNVVFILIAVAFGVSMLAIYKLYKNRL